MNGVRNIGTYCYDDPASRRNSECKVALKLENGFALIETKYYH